MIFRIRQNKNPKVGEKTYNIKTKYGENLRMNKWKNLALTYLLNFPVPPLLYQSFIPYIITIFLFFLPPPIFFLRELKKEGCMWEWWGERIREVSRIFFRSFFIWRTMYFIFTYCNLNAILASIVMNNIRKELVMITAHYGDQIISNQSTKSIKISNIDSNYMNKYCF